MSLGAVVRGKQERPFRVLIYGSEGIGKSTFAAGAPSPIFLTPEDGTHHLNVDRLPRPENWQDMLDAVDALHNDKSHSYKTLVIDTLDSAEAMLWAYLCARDKKTSIEDYGYGKGYAAALDEWRAFLASLERLSASRGMNVLFVAHSWVKAFKNPEGEDYDRYEMKLHAKAGGLIKEWSDAVLFARLETFAEKDKKGTVKGVSSGARVMHTTRTAAWDAKSRYSLPEVIPLDFEEFARAVVVDERANAFKAEIAALLEQLQDKTRAELARDAVIKAGDDAAKLSKIHNRLSALVSAQGA